jgi:hypothetical protein
MSGAGRSQHAGIDALMSRLWLCFFQALFGATAAQTACRGNAKVTFQVLKGFCSIAGGLLNLAFSDCHTNTYVHENFLQTGFIEDF